MHDRSRTRFLFREYLIRLGKLVGEGSWDAEAIVEEGPTKDGKGTLFIGARPAAQVKGVDQPTPLPRSATEPLGGGRKGEVAGAIVQYLRGRQEAHYVDILAAMEEQGYSATAVNANVRVLRNLRFITQDSKGAPYRLAEHLAG